MAGDHERCRHLVWRKSPETGEIEPGPYCRNALGVFPLLDCPEFQGRDCREFEPREGDPEPAVEDELSELASALAADFLGWRYWRRIRALAGDAPPEVPGSRLPE